jgi:antitoxin Phd
MHFLYFTGHMLTVLADLIKIAIMLRELARSSILIIEDASLRGGSAVQALEGAGFLVSKSDADSALHRLGLSDFAAVVTDLETSPGGRGLNVAKKIRALSPDMALILLVDEPSNTITVEAAELSAIPLVKPVNTALLRRTIQHALGLSRRNTTLDSKKPNRVEWEPTGPTMRMTATKAKNQMGRMLRTVMRGGVVLITNRKNPEAAVIPMAEYEKLTGRAEARIDALTREFDELLARMQAPEARAGMQAAFDASPEELARNAVTYARKRG